MHFMSFENFTINVVKHFFRSLLNLCSSGGQHFLPRGAQSPKAAVSRACLQLIPLLVREALGSRDAAPGQGNWCWHCHICPVQRTACASSQQGSEQPERHQPAGHCRAVGCAALRWEAWHQPHAGKNSLRKNSRTLQIPQELPKGWWLAVYTYFCRSAI